MIYSKCSKEKYKTLADNKYYNQKVVKEKRKISDQERGHLSFRKCKMEFFKLKKITPRNNTKHMKV